MRASSSIMYSPISAECQEVPHRGDTMLSTCSSCSSSMFRPAEPRRAVFLEQPPAQRVAQALGPAP